MNGPYAQQPGEGQPTPGAQPPTQSAPAGHAQQRPPVVPEQQLQAPHTAQPPAPAQLPHQQQGAPAPAAPQEPGHPPPGQQPPGHEAPAQQSPEEQLAEMTGVPTDGLREVDTSNQNLQDGVNRCPRCGATDIQLRASSGMLMCLFCRHEWAEKQFDQNKLGDVPISDLRGTVIGTGAAEIQADVNEIVTMKCSGCGAEVVVNTAEAMSARCHWCRHNLTVNEQIPNGAVPDAVLPFALTRDQAIERIREFTNKRKMFADRTFRKEFRPENVAGVYMPYMVVDANASVDAVGEGEVQTRRYTRKRGDKRVTVYDADVYRLERHLDFTTDDLTLESSAERADMNTLVNTNNIINTILPFDTENAVRWNANYLNGFSSEKRDQDVSHLEPVLENQLLSIGRSRLTESIRNYGRGVRWEAERINVHGTRWVSMYLPVWLYSYYHTERGKNMVHYIAVNARTGETMGSIPVSHGRLWIAAITSGTIIEGAAIAALVATL